MEETGAAPPSPPPARTIGERLRAGRERAGLSVAAAAEKLHLDPKVIEALEADRFAELGASVYVRGHLRRYGDFVGEQGMELVSAYAAREAQLPSPDLTQIPHAERSSDPRRLVSPLAGLGAAIAVGLAMWWVFSGSKGPGALPTEAPAEASSPLSAAPADSSAAVAATSATAPVRPAEATQTTAPAATVATPAAGSAPEATPARREETPARATRLTLELSNDSWVEIYDSRGERLFYDVASAGSVQRVEGRAPLRVVLGNAAGVAVAVDGQARQIPESAADGDGARFVVNRSGSLSRARQ